MFKIPESVLVVIYTLSGKVLLIERADHAGFWQSVTGSRASLDEALWQTACREVEEETGIVVRAKLAHDNEQTQGNEPVLSDWGITNTYEIYPIWRHRYAPGVTHNTEHVFGLVVPDNIPITLAPREHTHYCWLPFKEAAERCFSASNRDAILRLKQ